MTDDSARPVFLLRLPVFALSRLGQLARTEVKNAFTAEGLSFRAHFVLMCLDEYGELSQRELADLVAMDRSDLVKLLDTLERSGQLSRGPDPHDRRRHILTVTAAGTTTMRQGQHLIAQATDRVLGRLDPDQREALHRLVLDALDGQTLVS